MKISFLPAKIFFFSEDKKIIFTGKKTNSTNEIFFYSEKKKLFSSLKKIIVATT